MISWSVVVPLGIFHPAAEVFPRAGDDLTIPEKLRGHVQVPPSFLWSSNGMNGDNG